jgi:hypothetical protein
MAETTLREGMAEEQRRREEAERERDDLRRELHALREGRESPETVEEEPERAEPHSATEGAQEGTERPQQRSGWLAPVDKIPWWYYGLIVIIVSAIPYLFSGAGPLNPVVFQVVPRTTVTHYLIFGALWWGVPSICGFWVGLKSKTVRIWTQLLPMGALAGIAGAVASVPSVEIYSWQDIYGWQGELFQLTLWSFIPSTLLFVSGALIGKARQRRATATRTGITPRAKEHGADWTPQRQAMIGLAGTVLAALISLLGTIGNALLSS